MSTYNTPAQQGERAARADALAFTMQEGDGPDDERFVVVWRKRLLGQPQAAVVTQVAQGYADWRGAASDVRDWYDMTDDGYETVSATVMRYDDLEEEMKVEVDTERVRYGLRALR